MRIIGNRKFKLFFDNKQSTTKYLKNVVPRCSTRAPLPFDVNTIDLPSSNMKKMCLHRRFDSFERVV